MLCSLAHFDCKFQSLIINSFAFQLFLFKLNFDSQVNVFYGRLNDVSKISLGEGAGFAFFDRKEFDKVTRGNRFIKEIMKMFEV